MIKEYKIVGKGMNRKDSFAKVTGSAKFATDFLPKGMLYGKYLGSAIPHGYIKSIDTTIAESLPGVIAVMTGKDVPDIMHAGYIEDRFVLAKEKVRYIGDPIAAVAATSEEAAYAALDAIEVEYEELPYILDFEEAQKAHCPVVVHEDLENYHFFEQHNVSFGFDKNHPNQIIHRRVRHGDVEKGFEEADLVVESEYRLPRAHPSAMEPHNCIVVPSPDGTLTIHASEQAGLTAKGAICHLFGLTTSQVHWITPYVGGGFGSKVDIMVTPIATALALKTGKPVKLEMTREEVFTSGSPRCGAVVRIKDGVMNDGTLVARQIEEVMDGGGYSTYVTVMVSEGIYGATGTYRVPNFKLDAHGVYTNTPPNGPFRSLGSEILAFAIESQMNKIADKLGIDQVEIRRKNVLVDGDVDVISQTTHNNGTLSCLNKVADYLDWGEAKKELPSPWVYGRGVSLGNKFSACGSTGTAAMCKIHPDGKIELRYFHIEMGQGADTVLAQIAAEEFDVPYEDILVNPRDSDFCPHDEGTYCSRGTYVNGHAVMLACRDAIRQIKDIAAKQLNVSEYSLEVKNGRVYEINNEKNGLTFAELYQWGGYLLRGAEILGKDTFKGPEGSYDSSNGQGNPVDYYSYGALGFEMAVNTETGDLKLLNAVGVYDMGQPINITQVHAQIDGAMSMGIGQAMFEEVIINDKGAIINGNFRDYKVPTALDMPNNDKWITDRAGEPLAAGPYGAKGFGEVALVPVAPGVSNAINDALGVKINTIPLTKERVLMALREKTK